MVNQKTLTTRDIIVLTLLIAGILAYFFVLPKISVDPITEKKRMDKLETTKQRSEISKFETDGCSGNISNAWDVSVEGLSKISQSFKEKYQDTRVPFESACVEHDKLYHSGIGGYEGRLLADNKLRKDIILYGINNADTIIKDTSIKTKEEVIFIYEIIAEAIYRGVRVGGSPCTSEPHAWGYGYNNGVCE